MSASNPQRRCKPYVKIFHNSNALAVSAMEFRDSLGNLMECDFIRLLAFGNTDTDGMMVAWVSAAGNVPASAILSEDDSYVNPIHTATGSGLCGIAQNTDIRGAQIQDIFLPQGQFVTGVYLANRSQAGITAVMYGRTVPGNAMDGHGAFIGN